MTLLNRLPFFPLYYKGETKFTPIHCSELAEIILQIINKNICSEIIECVGPQEMTFNEILQKLLKLIDKKNKQVGFFDLGNHILIVGMVLLVIFVSMNVD